MKQLLILLSILVGLTAGFSQTANADGAVTAEEQQIIDKLSSGVTVGGKTYYLDGGNLTKAINYLKENDLTTAEVNEVLSDIDNIVATIAASDVDVSDISSLEELAKALPKNVIESIKASLSDIGNVLGLVITYGKSEISISEKKSGATIYSAGEKVVKNTDSNSIMSLLMLAALFFFALVAYIIGKKQNYANI
ncbi:MAG: hypothetical protein LKF42_03755 [Streptococcaceae bacterium]|jgi:uncharacterized membrane protein|nr:hypothetical protein [Streptococcaceae bacterium]MCH4176939.1 hypothetical protein [Streptococcaceae bacterium]